MTLTPSLRACAPREPKSLAKCSTRRRTGSPTSAGPKASLSRLPNNLANSCRVSSRHTGSPSTIRTSRHRRRTLLVKRDQFDRGAVVDDHRRADAVRWGCGWKENLLALKCRVEIIHLEGHVRHGPDQLGKGTVRLEAHPLDAERAGLETRDVHLESREVSFAAPRDFSRHSDVVIAPAQFLDNPRKVTI